MKANPVEVFRSKSRLRQWLVIHLTWADFDQAIGDKPLHWYQKFFRWVNWP